jgi:predicted Zn-dependent protease
MAVEGRLVEAEDKYKELLTNEPNNAVLVNNYGSILHKQGKKKEAIAQFRQSIKLAPDLKDAINNLAAALAETPAPPVDASPPPPGDKPKPTKSNVPAKKDPAPK